MGGYGLSLYSLYDYSFCVMCPVSIQNYTKIHTRNKVCKVIKFQITKIFSYKRWIHEYSLQSKPLTGSLFQLAPSEGLLVSFHRTCMFPGNVLPPLDCQFNMKRVLGMLLISSYLHFCQALCSLRNRKKEMSLVS